ncbi:MAG TPA: hypothetical protein VNG13_09760 [Mycobacteriales bacterium]|nr:hypothetical protein [Mycobacteriales bacterium]
MTSRLARAASAPVAVLAGLLLLAGGALAAVVGVGFAQLRAPSTGSAPIVAGSFGVPNGVVVVPNRAAIRATARGPAGLGALVPRRPKAPAAVVTASRVTASRVTAPAVAPRLAVAAIALPGGKLAAAPHVLWSRAAARAAVRAIPDRLVHRLRTRPSAARGHPARPTSHARHHQDHADDGED